MTTYQSDEEYAKALQAQYDAELTFQPPPSTSTYDSVIQTVMQMPFDSHATQLADQFGLSIVNVTWEDNARYKNSCWGPCISDMTLQVEGHNLPVIRSPNYEDITWDVELDRIPLMVGNEHDENLVQVSLREYLENFRDYLHDPSSWSGSTKSLLRDEDTHAIMSSQACFLPIPPMGGEANFNVSIFNYQTRPGDPAILSIVASSNGTSAQIVDQRGSQKLYFNKNGEKCSFVGKRLSQHRIEQGRENDGSEMNEEEKQQNILLIIQVPLKQKEIMVRNIPSFAFAQCQSLSLAPQNTMLQLQSARCVDVEDAIISIGDSEGEFREIGNLAIERDTRFPIRVTLQYYKATSNGAVNDEIMSGIYEQLVQSRDFGENVGSLVVGGQTNRPTEYSNTEKYGGYRLPPWWNEFWLMYGPTFPQYTKEQAADKVFVNGRFCQSTLSESKSRILSILGDGNPPPVKKPSWGIFKTD